MSAPAAWYARVVRVLRFTPRVVHVVRFTQFSRSLAMIPGGFGSDHTDRGELIKICKQRAKEMFPDEEFKKCYHIGDAPTDIKGVYASSTAAFTPFSSFTQVVYCWGLSNLRAMIPPLFLPLLPF